MALAPKNPPSFWMQKGTLHHDAEGAEGLVGTATVSPLLFGQMRVRVPRFFVRNA